MANLINWNIDWLPEKYSWNFFFGIPLYRRTNDKELVTWSWKRRKKTKKANSALHQVTRNLRHSRQSIPDLVRLKLEYCVSVWSPHKSIVSIDICILRWLTGEQPVQCTKSLGINKMSVQTTYSRIFCGQTYRKGTRDYGSSCFTKFWINSKRFLKVA